MSLDVLASASQDAASWASAVGTVLAVVVALGLGLLEVRRSRSRDEMAQAAHIAAWLDVGEFEGRLTVRLLIKNSSQLAATQFRATIHDLRTTELGAHVLEVNGVAPTGEPVVRSVPVPLPPSTEDEVYRLSALQFTDANGRIWERTPSALKRIDQHKR